MATRNSLFWTAIAQVLLFIIQFGGTLIVTRLLTPEQTGTFALCMAIVGLFSVLQNNGLNMYIVRENEFAREVTIAAFTLNSFAACIVSLIAFAIAEFNFLYDLNASIRQTLLIITIVPIVSIFEFVPSALLERQNSFKPIVLINVSRNFIGACVTIICASHGFGAVSLAYGQLASSVFGMLLINFVGRKHILIAISLRGTKRMLTFSFQIIGMSSLTRIGQRASEILIASQLGLDALGIYNRASSIFTLIWDNLHSTLTRVIFVDFSTAVREGKSLRDRYLIVVEVMTTLLWPAFMGLAIVAGPLIRQLYGEKWSAVAEPLSIISVSAIMLVSITMTGELFIIKGETSKQIKLESVRSVASVSMLAAGTSLGLSWVAASRIGDSIIANIMYRRFILRYTSVSARDLIKIYCRSGIISLVTIGPCVYLRAVSHDWNAISPTQLFGSVSAGAFLWLLVVIVINHPIYREILRVVHKLECRAHAG